ncbi:cation-translocating P-type ATPase [Nocardioides sp.]|uniref:cation-translocating P-type ATPase n=1 Tax=Nocardioides sp. TaxID=35761 RepID=UPI003D0FAB31
MTATSGTAGLSAEQVTSRRQRDGANVVPPARRTPPWRQLVAQLTHFFAGMLWVASFLALLAGMPSLAGAIAVIVVLNGVFAFLQEHKADRAADELNAMMPATTRVVRDGETHSIPVADLVVDDLVLVEAGDRIGADLRILEAHELTVDESMLTGESLPQSRPAGTDVFAGTFAVQGDASGQVVAIGTGTRLAGIAALTDTAERPSSPLAVQLHKLVLVVAAIAVSVGLLLSVASLAIGSGVTTALLLGVGVMVALVPEGLLPTVTLSLARGAQRMAGENALVRHLEAVETLGATTFICTDKTGTLTRNEMSVVEGWTPAGSFQASGTGYAPSGAVLAAPEVRSLLSLAAVGALGCATGRSVERKGSWVAEGDPMDAALDAFARRLEGGAPSPGAAAVRIPFTAAARCSAAVVDGTAYVMGAPEVLLDRCGLGPDTQAQSQLLEMSSRGRRVIAVTRAPVATPGLEITTEAALMTAVGGGLELLALLGIEDPPRAEVFDAVALCHRAGIRLAMLTGDSAATGAAIATEVGLLGPSGTVVEGADLPAGDHEIADLLDRVDGAVVARVTPADKLRIARALRSHGHVVAMTGDGVNDAAALREADVGVAMGRSGSDVAREAADLVLLDDSFATIPKAIQLGRGTFANIRRFLTFHLTDNVAELVPFVLWALTGSNIPLAIGVLQVLALDIGTDMLPALALGAEPANERTMNGPRRTTEVVDGRLLRRALLLLGPTEALLSMGAFLTILTMGGWQYGEEASAGLLSVASGSAFAVIAVAQMANAFACRSETHPAWLIDPRTNPFVLVAVAVEVALLVGFLGVPWLSELLGGSWPSSTGWLFCLLAAVTIPLVDALHKWGARALARD